MLRRVLLVIVFGALAAAGPAGSAHAQTGGEHIAAFSVTMTLRSDGALGVSEAISYDFGVVPHHGIFRDLVVRETYDAHHDRRYTIEATARRRPEQLGDRGQDLASGRLPPRPHRRSQPNRHRRALLHDLVHRARRAADVRRSRRALLGRDRQPVAGEHRSRHCARRARRHRSRRSRASRGRRVRRCPATVRRSTRTRRRSWSPISLRTKASRSSSPCRRARSSRRPNRFSNDAAPSARRSRYARTPSRRRACSRCSRSAAVVFVVWRRGRDRRYTGSAVDAAMGNVTGEEERQGLLPAPAGPVEFIPPDGIRPGQVGTLADEHANVLDVTATIVDLAVRGWLTITDISEGDYQLAATQNAGKGTLLPYETMLMNDLFASGPDGEALRPQVRVPFRAARGAERAVRRRRRAGLVPHATRSEPRDLGRHRRARRDRRRRADDPRPRGQARSASFRLRSWSRGSC